jgi:hypothetical protein
MGETTVQLLSRIQNLKNLLGCLQNYFDSFVIYECLEDNKYTII